METREDALRYFHASFADTEKRFLQAGYRSPWTTWVGCGGSFFLLIPLAVVLTGSGPRQDIVLTIKAVALVLCLVGVGILLKWRGMGQEQTIFDLQEKAIYRGRGGKPSKLLYRFDEVKGLGVKSFLYKSQTYNRTTVTRYYCPVLICDHRVENFQELAAFGYQGANAYIQALALLLDKPFYEIEPDQQLSVTRSGELLGVGYRKAPWFEVSRLSMSRSPVVQPEAKVGSTEEMLRKGKGRAL